MSPHCNRSTSVTTWELKASSTESGYCASMSESNTLAWGTRPPSTAVKMSFVFCGRSLFVSAAAILAAKSGPSHPASAFNMSAEKVMSANSSRTRCSCVTHSRSKALWRAAALMMATRQYSSTGETRARRRRSNDAVRLVGTHRRGSESSWRRASVRCAECSAATRRVEIGNSGKRARARGILEEWHLAQHHTPPVGGLVAAICRAGPSTCSRLQWVQPEPQDSSHAGQRALCSMEETEMQRTSWRGRRGLRRC